MQVETEAKGTELLVEVIDPEIKSFEDYFAEKAGGGPLSSYEREILKAYLWFKLMEARDEGG
tara:strand:+ start:1425 stop:1610 length:186 start_codon:yes stop_codon:yes gene_type:complete